MGIAYLLFLSSAVQTHVSRKLANYLSEKTHTPIQIEKVYLSPFKSLVIKGLYFEDYRKDTLMYVEHVKLKVDSFSLKKKQLYVKQLQLINSYFNLQEAKEKRLNIRVFLDSLAKKENKNPDDSLRKSWDVNISKLNIRKSSFRYQTAEYEPQDYGMNYDHIDVTDLNIEAQDVKLSGDSAVFFIRHLSCKEKSGFELKDFQSNSWITNQQWGLSDVDIVSKHSHLKAKHVCFNYRTGEGYWQEFTKKMQLDFLLKPSSISFLDLSYFNSKLLGFKETGRLSGKIYGTIYNLKGKDIYIEYGRNTSIKGAFYINGLPYLKDSYLAANIHELNTNIPDIEQVYIPGNLQKKIQFPKYLNKLGAITYKGKFNGFINDFVFYGKFNTDLGEIKTDILFKPGNKNHQLHFTGDLSTRNFELGGLANWEKVGQISLKVSVNGAISNESTKGIIKGNISHVDFFDYKYQNVSLNGFFSESLFDGKISVNDPNINFDFSGQVDFSKQVPKMNFSSRIDGAKLFPLHLNRKDKKAEISLSLNANFTGNSLDNTNGIIEINDTEYKNSLGRFFMKNLDIKSFTAPGFKSAKLKSDLFDMNIEGHYEMKKLIASAKNLIYFHLPAYAPNKEYTETDSSNQFAFQIQLKNTEKLSAILYPETEIAPSTKIHGKISTFNRKLDIKCQSPKIKIKNNTFNEVSLELNSNENQFQAKGRSNQYSFFNHFHLYNFSNKINIQNNKIDIDAFWNNWDQSTYSGFLSAKGEVERSPQTGNPKWNIQLNPGSIVMADSVWNIPKSNIVIDSNSYEIDHFRIEGKDQHFCLYGKISTNPKDRIHFKVQNIDLKHANDFFRDQHIGIEGNVNGYVQIRDFYGKRFSNSNIRIENMVLHQDTLGDFSLLSNWNHLQEKLEFSASTNFLDQKELKLTGKYFPYSDSIDANINIDNLRLQLLNPYFQNNLSHIKGHASGNLHLHGKTKNLKSKGIVKFKHTTFTVKALNTTYYCHDSIEVLPEALQFNQFIIEDQKNEKASLTGSITHKQFADFRFALSANTSNFNILNTKESHNERFYGKAYVSGVSHLKGALNDMEIEVRAKTDHNTQIFVPIRNSGDIRENHFITFVNTETPEKEQQQETKEERLSGIRLNCDLEITPETDIQIIFDSKVGDVLKAKGEGNLKLEIDNKGEFQMFGDYTIQEGSYLFTLQNVINKRFDLLKGGNIEWAGNPYSANINIDASYKVKTSLYDLLLNTPYVDINKKIPVECKMNLRQNLQHPLIQFSIDFPTLDQQTQTVLEGLFSSEDETNKQILSLLVLNRFYTPEHLRSTDPDFENKNSSYGVGVTTSELLSNQLSNWLSQISNDFDIGVSYRPGDELTSDEIQLALSTQMFDDKVSINGNVGTSNSQERANNIVGDVDVNIKLDKSGKLQLKAFSRSNEYLIYEESRNTQGIGIFYKEDFNKLSELFRKYIRFFQKKTKDEEP